MSYIKSKALFSFFLLLFASLTLTAQTVITGTVVDESTNEPLPGASVVVEGTSVGTATGFDGKFSIELPGDSGNLIISSLGFSTRTVAVDNTMTQLSVRLEEDASQLDNVVVTANKTLQSSQRVAQSINVISPKGIQRTGAREFRDYASGIPNLSFGTQGGDAGGRFANEISIRGITGARTTAMYLNESPLPESISPNLIDVSRIEVLKGPQGTLYGSATMGGAVKVLTNKPNPYKTEGFIDVEGAAVKEGDFDYNVEGLINVPLADKLAFRVSGYYNFTSGIFDRVPNKTIPWINDDPILTEDFYGDTQDLNGDPFNIVTDGCEGCSREDKENVDDRTDVGFNANIGFYPTENLSFIGTVIHQSLVGDGYDFAEGDVNNFIQNSNTGLDEYFEDKWTHYSLNTEIKTAVGSVTLSSNYLNRAFTETEDVSEINTYWWLEYDEEPGVVPLTAIWGATVDRAVDTQLFQQEIRFNSDFEGKFNFVSGLFYSRQKQHWDYYDAHTGLPTYVLSDNALYADAPWGETQAEYDYILNNTDLPWYSYVGDFNDREFALFGQFYYQITEKLKFTLGLRYFDVRLQKDINETGADFGFVNSPFQTDFSENGLNPKFNLTYEIDKDKLIYATAAKGFRIGDSNELLPSFAQEEIDTQNGEMFIEAYESDYIWNYELGFKSAWADNKIIANMAVFYNKWGNLQQYRLLPSGWGYTFNVGSAHSAGVELDLRAKATRELELGLGVGLLDPKIDEGTDFIASVDDGDRILYSTKFTANAMAQYTKEFSNGNSMYLRADLQHMGERMGTYEPENEPDLVFPAYTLINARAAYVFPKLEIALFCRNLTNKQANFGSIQSFAGNLPGRERLSTNRPITVGINLRYSFSSSQ